MSLKNRIIGTVLSVIVIIIYSLIIEDQKESRKAKEELKRRRQDILLREYLDSTREERDKEIWDKDSAERNKREREMIENLKKINTPPKHLE